VPLILAIIVRNAVKHMVVFHPHKPLHIKVLKNAGLVISNNYRKSVGKKEQRSGLKNISTKGIGYFQINK